ncbi:4944_t:CDS:2 [Ambispora gerdemannii]|uniref:4944_t:CDS:1 n=1 Tax=Ambispora gerdemannii TaxID=144530 RepID=A0A9N9BAB9_9GLOM|nr:4944_t:CDS:2 [Ambispora gerdemannii]
MRKFWSHLKTSVLRLTFPHTCEVTQRFPWVGYYTSRDDWNTPFTTAQSTSIEPIITAREPESLTSKINQEPPTNSIVQDTSIITAQDTMVQDTPTA